MEGTDYERWSAEDLVAKLDSLPDEVRTQVRNNGGGQPGFRLALRQAVFFRIQSF